LLSTFSITFTKELKSSLNEPWQRRTAVTETWTLDHSASRQPTYQESLSMCSQPLAVLVQNYSAS
jgi:hypothetical protein